MNDEFSSVALQLKSGPGSLTAEVCISQQLATHTHGKILLNA